MRRNTPREGLKRFRDAQRGPPSPIPTLAMLQATLPGKWVWVCCAAYGCTNKRAFALAPFVIRWGPNGSSDALRRSVPTPTRVSSGFGWNGSPESRAARRSIRPLLQLISRPRSFLRQSGLARTFEEARVLRLKGRIGMGVEVRLNGQRCDVGIDISESLDGLLGLLVVA